MKTIREIRRGLVILLTAGLMSQLGAVPCLAQPVPGSYVGTTQQGEQITVTVGSSGAITGWKVKYNCPSFSSTVTVGTSCPVNGNSFTCGQGGCSPFLANTRISGTFSGTTVSGSLLVNHQPNQFASCCVLSNLTWSATLATPGSLSFSSAVYSESEGAASATVTVRRTGGSDGEVSVGYSTGGGTATAGDDYQASSGTLTWAGGDTSDKTFQVPILEDAVDESDETVILTLSGPTGGATLQASSTATLFITDNDEPPPADFFTVTPCRVVDTREPAQGPALVSEQPVLFQVSGACGIPSTARAVSFNITVVSPSGAGHLTLYPGDSQPPLVSTLNFDAGEVLANNAILRLAANGDGTLGARPVVLGGGSVHLILDVNGYFE